MFFVALFSRYSWVRKFFFLSKVANIVRWWGSSNYVVDWVWGVPRFRDIPLGPAQVPSLRFSGFVASLPLNL